MTGSSLSYKVAVDLGITESRSIGVNKCCKIDTFLFFPTFWEILTILFQNNCYSATTSIKIKEFQRYLKIIKDISGSSSGSSLVAVGSSWVASGYGKKSTATTFYYFKSISYIKGSRVALDFIQARKSPFLPVFGSFFIGKTCSVALDFQVNIFLFQCIASYLKINCYQRFLPGGDHPIFRVLLLRYDIESSLYDLFSKFVVYGFEGLFEGLMVKVMEKVGCSSCGGGRLGFGFQVGWNQVEKAKLVTAHNYKKCGSKDLGSNEINRLQIIYIQESVVGFGMGESSDTDRGMEDPPPIDNSGSQGGPHHLLLAINCKDFIRGFYTVLWLLYMVSRMFGFRKVGGLGGVLI